MYTRAWTNFFEVRGEKRLLFPREVFLTRSYVGSLHEFLELMKQFYKTSDCYTSVYSPAQAEMGILDTIFLDLDIREGETFEEVRKRMQKICNILEKKGYRYRLYFTGGRGFHFYLDFPPILLRHPFEAIRAWAKRYGITKYVDLHILGDVRRLARVPYTINTKTGLFCYPINPDATFEEALSPPLRLYESAMNLDLGIELRYLDSQIPDRPKEVLPVPELGDVPPCVVGILAKIDENPSHMERLHLAAYMITRGVDVGSLEEVFSKVKDFRKRITAYQLEAIKRGRLRPYSCWRLIEAGICPLDEEKRIKCPKYLITG